MDSRYIQDRLKNARHGIKHRFEVSLVSPLILDVLLWDDVGVLQRALDLPEDRIALGVFTIDPAVYIGSLHFVGQMWNINVISHEVFHVVMHMMRMQKAFKSVFDKGYDVEENFALLMGKTTQRIYNELVEYDTFMPQLDPPDAPDKEPEETRLN